jgi:hypothetical protein
VRESLLLLALLAAGQAHASGSAATPTCAAGDPPQPSRVGFMREVLDAAPTARTRLFKDEAPDGYYPEPADIADGLDEQAAQCGHHLEGALVVGAYGPLSSYLSVAFLRESSDLVRVNAVVMAHRRITWKGSTLLPAPWVTELFDEIAAVPGARRATRPKVRRGLIPPAQDGVLLLRRDRRPGRWYVAISSRRRPTATQEGLLQTISAMTDLLTSTYPPP